MTDCPNADIRDQLPDLLHGHLDEASRARVESHLRECQACREELALLRSVLKLAPVVPVDVARVVAALPASRPRRRWGAHVWQMAAAVVFLAVSGSAVLRYAHRTGAVGTAAPHAVGSALHGDSATGGASGEIELSVGAGLSDLTDAQLEALLQDMQQIKAIPLSDPEVSVPEVTVTNGGA